MSDMKRDGLSRLSTTTGVDMQTGAKQVLYTPPAGERGIPTHLLIIDPSATLDGCDDVDFGTGASADTGLNNETGIGDMTATTDYMLLPLENNEYTIVDGDAAALVDRQFGIKVIDGSDGVATATIMVLGIVVDS